MTDSVQTFRGHTDHVGSVATLSENTFVSASQDRTLRLWKVGNNDALQTFRGHRGLVWSVAKLSEIKFVGKISKDFVTTFD